jgi:hypothetical protein
MRSFQIKCRGIPHYKLIDWSTAVIDAQASKTAVLNRLYGSWWLMSEIRWKLNILRHIFIKFPDLETT